MWLLARALLDSSVICVGFENPKIPNPVGNSENIKAVYNFCSVSLSIEALSLRDICCCVKGTFNKTQSKTITCHLTEFQN